MSDKLTREDCIIIIRQKNDLLGRIPKKSDFNNEVASMIKSYFGPWPRALESAGVKAPNLDRIAKKREKRERTKQNRIKYRKEHQKEEQK